MKYIRKLPTFEELKTENCLSEEEVCNREKHLHAVKDILSGKDKRKLVIIGPCSADRSDAVLEYVSRLKKVSEEIREKVYIIPRVYTGKPRTTGAGYKGMVHSPTGNGDENIMEGISAARNLHIKVIRETGMYSADEMLYLDEMYYLSDVLGYLAVGARSVEDQAHRMLASDSTLPVGMKNPTGGSKVALVNGIRASQMPHRMMFMGYEVETEGNQYSHAILRGFTNKSGRNYSNYHYEDLVELFDLVSKNNIMNPGVIIDCNHANSNKQYDEQPRIVREVFGHCRDNESINKFVKGFMIESYLEDGAQMVGQGVYGKSITDPCLGWKKTEKLLYEMADY